MNNNEMKKMAVKAGVFGILSIAIMLQRAATKHIMITDAAGASIDRGTSENSFNILIDRNVPKEQSGKLIIPLSKTVGSDDITLEDRYMDHELRIYIDSREEGFYLGNAVMTDLDILESAVCITEKDSGSVCLDFKLKDLYANSSSLTEFNTIEVEFDKPSRMYDNIVVVDCGTDIVEGDSTSVDIALALKEISSSDTENDIKFYFTRLDNNKADVQKNAELIKETKPDLVVGINGAEIAFQGLKSVAAYYNDQFFLRSLNNSTFADMIEKSVANNLGAVGQGVFTAESDDLILLSANVPAARISVKCMPGEDERKAVATGIYEAVIEAFKKIN